MIHGLAHVRQYRLMRALTVLLLLMGLGLSAAPVTGQARAKTISRRRELIGMQGARRDSLSPHRGEGRGEG